MTKTAPRYATVSFFVKDGKGYAFEERVFDTPYDVQRALEWRDMLRETDYLGTRRRVLVPVREVPCMVSPFNADIDALVPGDTYMFGSTIYRWAKEHGRGHFVEDNPPKHRLTDRLYVDRAGRVIARQGHSCHDGSIGNDNRTVFGRIDNLTPTVETRLAALLTKLIEASKVKPSRIVRVER